MTKPPQPDNQSLREQILDYCFTHGAVSRTISPKDLPVVQIRIDRLEALIADQQRALLDRLLEHTQEYELTDIELLDYHQGTPLRAIPVEALERERKKL